MSSYKQNYLKIKAGCIVGIIAIGFTSACSESQFGGANGSFGFGGETQGQNNGDANPNGSIGPNGVGGNGGPGSTNGTGGQNDNGQSSQIGVGSGTDTATSGIAVGGGSDCSKSYPGLNGLVYRLQSNASALPTNYAAMTSVGQLSIPQLNIPLRDFTQGFPGVANLFENFSIVFEGNINIPSTGNYWFKTEADDGVKVYIDNNMVISHDGVHQDNGTDDRNSRKICGTNPNNLNCTPKSLSQGMRPIRIEWFQGPAVKLALQFFASTNGSTFSIVDASWFSHTKVCGLNDLGAYNSDLSKK